MARAEESEVHPLFQYLLSWFPMLLLIGVWVFFMRQMQSGGGRAMGFGKSRARLLTEKQGRITFEDVAGIDEAKGCLLYTSPSPRDGLLSRMPSSAYFTFSPVSYTHLTLPTILRV